MTEYVTKEIEVIWKAGDDWRAGEKNWRSTTERVRNSTGILEYRIFDRGYNRFSRLFRFQYRLEIKVAEERDYKYTFFQKNEKSGDYTLRCYTQGRHNVDFDTEQSVRDILIEKIKVETTSS